MQQGIAEASGALPRLCSCLVAQSYGCAGVPGGWQGDLVSAQTGEEQEEQGNSGIAGGVEQVKGQRIPHLHQVWLECYPSYTEIMVLIIIH